MFTIECCGDVVCVELVLNSRSEQWRTLQCGWQARNRWIWTGFICALCTEMQSAEKL